MEMIVTSGWILGIIVFPVLLVVGILLEATELVTEMYIKRQKNKKG
jgi:hypothetical protein